MNLEKLRKLRKEAGLSQAALAKTLGYETNTVICMWESGERKPPSDKLPALAAALHCTINDLFDSSAQ